MRTTLTSLSAILPLFALAFAAFFSPGQPAALAQQNNAAAAAGVEFFEKKVRPILVEHCYSCHSAKDKKIRGGLALDTRAALLRGGDTGKAVEPGKPDDSLLIRHVRYLGDTKMPPKEKLPAAMIADLERWVQMGAPMPEEKTPVVVTAPPGIEWKQARKFWSFQPVSRPPVPAVKNAAWPRNPLDHFVLSRLEAEGLTPVAFADARTLIRRLTFDLTGLPPTPEEVDDFVNDKRPDAYERLVERLLASPAYGERWARHWLDVARYAEDQAHTFGVKPNTNAWRYRDWVVNALNDDLPYDRFVRLQIAADQMTDAALADRSALGFFGLGAQYYKNTDAARATADELDDRVDTLARGFMGLTVSCARCHDHKYDPIPTQDYYSLAGVFHSSRLSDLSLASKEETDRHQAAMKRVQDSERAYRDALRQEKGEMAKTKLARLNDYLLVAWSIRAANAKNIPERAKQEGLDPAILRRCVTLVAPDSKQGPNLAVMVPFRQPIAKDAATTPPEQLKEAATKLQKDLIALAGRDDRSYKGPEKVLAQVFLSDNGVFALSDRAVLEQLPADRKSRIETMRQESEKAKREQPAPLPVAHGLADASATDMKVYIRGNPATQGAVAPRRFLRVLSANEEPGKFTKGSGRLELAEAIANRDNPLTARVMVNRLWMHHFGRGIVNTPSNFGQLGDRPTHPELLDWLASEFIENGWSLKQLHRLIVTSSAYRLSSANHEGNQVKDPDNQFYWRMSRRRLDIESWRDALLAVSGQLDRTLGGPTVDLNNDNNRRRTVYAKISRHELSGLLRLFDFPDANITAEKRTETTVPQQQLFVLNSPFVVARTKALDARVQADSAATPEAQVKRAYELVFGRPPSAEETKVLSAYLSSKDDGEETGKNQLNRRERLMQVLLASNEFLYVD